MELNARQDKQTHMTPERIKGLAEVNRYLDEHPDVKAANEAIGKGYEQIRDSAR